MFVKIIKNKNSVPSDNEIETAMKNSRGQVISIEEINQEKTVYFTGNVNHTVFENELIEVAHGNKMSWTFDWADAV